MWDLLNIAVTQLLALAAILLMTFWSLRGRKLYGFLFLGLSVFGVLQLFALPSLVDEFGHAAVADAVMYGLIGSLCLVVTTTAVEIASGRSHAQGFRNPIADARLVWPSYLVMIVFCMALTIAIAARKGTGLYLQTWEDTRSDADLLDSLATLMQFFLFPAAWIAYRSKHPVAAVLLLLVALATFPVFGSRAALLALPAAIGIDVLRSRLTRGRLYRVLAIVAGIGLLLHVLGRIVRGLGLGGIYQVITNRDNAQQVLAEVSENVDWTGGESEVSRYFVYSVDKGDFDGMSVLASMTRWAEMYLPRWLAPDTKPEDVTYVLWRHATNDGIFDSYPSIERLIDLLQAGDSGSVHPTLWGEMWVNGGWLAIPAMAIGLAIILVAIEKIHDGAPRVVTALVAPATVVGYVMVARGNSVIGLGYSFYLLPVAFLMYMAVAVVKTTVWASMTSSPGSASKN